MAQLSIADDLASLGPGTRVGCAPSVSEAAAYCRRLARRHYENFTVASWLLPRHLAPHFHAVYAFCRYSDDLADEAASPEKSLALLEWWQGELDRCYAGEAEHPVFVALSQTIRQFEIPRGPFDRLLVAFRQDQRVTRYATHEDLLAYCRNSANPVGHLVLYLARAYDEPRAGLSDSICTGLQLANFCQDVARDFLKGRVYLPAATLENVGYTEAMLARREDNTAFRRAVREEVERAEAYLRAGEPLVERMPRELRVDVALFVEGGLAILRAIRNLDYNVWNTRPVISKATSLRLLARCWWRCLGGARREARR